MGSDERAVNELLGKLAIASEEERKELLENIAPILSSQAARSKYKSQLETSNLNVIFDCVNASSDDVVRVASDIVRNVLDLVDPRVILEQYAKCLLRCLDHPSSLVRCTILNFLKESQRWDHETVKALASNQSLVLTVLKTLIDPDLAVSKDAKVVCFSMAQRQPPSENFLFKPPALPLLQEMSKDSNETMRLRIYEFVVMVAKLSPEFTERTSEAGFLRDICNELLTTDDVLVQLNVLEILSDLAEVPHGFQFLKDQKALDHIDKLLDRATSSPFSDLLMPGFIKFFGRISGRQALDFTSCFPNFTSTLFHLLSENQVQEEELRSLALATVGHIAIGLHGKQQLLEVGGENVVGIMVAYLTRGTSDQKLDALNALTNILSTGSVPRGSDGFEEACKLSQAFFGLLEKRLVKQSVVGIAFDFAKQPFADVSMASYEVLKEMAEKRWGLARLVFYPGLVEFLLNRDVATSKAAKDAKYDLIRAMAENPYAEEVIAPEALTKLRRYVKEGRYYVESQVEVAIDEG